MVLASVEESCKTVVLKNKTEYMRQINHKLFCLYVLSTPEWESILRFIVLHKGGINFQCNFGTKLHQV